MDAAVQPYVEHLVQLPFVRRVRLRWGDGEVDGQVVLTTADRRNVALPFELKRSHLGVETAHRLIGMAGKLPGLLIMAPAVGLGLGQQFVEANVNYVDLAGNCHLKIGDRYVAHIQGQRGRAPEPAGRALRTPAFRVLFALLAEPELATATTRALAEAAGGVSPQTAHNLRTRLVADGVLVEARGALVWAPGGRRRGIDLFLTGFGALAAKLTVGRYRARGANVREHEAELTPHLDRLGEWRWGGGAAADRLTGFYRGDRTVLYLREAPPPDALRRLPLVPDREGNVVLRVAVGPLALRGPKPQAAHPLLVYADLVAEGNERSALAAEQVYERYLASESA